MARPTRLTPADLILRFQGSGALTAQKLTAALGVAQPTSSRGLARLGGAVVALGSARRARYALRRAVRSGGDRWPVYRVDATGRAGEWAQVHAVMRVPGESVAAVRILDAGGRSFFEIERFDRNGAQGRTGMVSLRSLHDALPAAAGTFVRHAADAVGAGGGPSRAIAALCAPGAAAGRAGDLGGSSGMGGGILAERRPGCDGLGGISGDRAARGGSRGAHARAVCMTGARRIVRLALAAAALALAGCATTPAPRVALGTVPVAQRVKAEGNVRVFSQVWSLVHDLHYDPKLQGVDWAAAGLKYGPQAAEADDDKALYASLNTMVGLLKDSHTRALTPEQARERRTQMRARTGFNMTRAEGKWVVSELLAGSPAEAAGVRAGWLVVARNGVVFGERMEVRPKDGEVAQWDFFDLEDRPVTRELTARPLSTKPRQEMRALPDGFVYLRFDAFDAANRRWLSAQLKEHRAAPGVVIDLRQNPGGGTISLGITIGEFFAAPVDCGTFIWRGGHRGGKRSWQIGSARYDGKVVLLVDGASGSAAEIFSAVLQEHGRATVVGRKTAGAVLASWFHGLPDGGELQLSRQDYVTPKGRRLEGEGVVPEVVVTRTLADLRAGRDADLAAALRVLSAATAR